MAKKKKRRLKKKYRILRGIYIAVVVIAAIIVIAYAALKFTVRAPEIKQPDDTGSQTSQEIVPGMTTGDHTRREQTYTFMLCCPDQASGNADAIMLVTYDVPNQKIGMLSVPRDTLVDQSSPKINAAMHKGVENLQSVVSDLVGYPIDFYIKIDLDGFRELVDAVGGVDFNVPVEMYYNDPTQDLSIFFQPGMQHLDGEDAMKVCRFRKNGDGTGYPMGDIQRSETVRKLMITVAKKLVANIGKLDPVREHHAAEHRDQPLRHRPDLVRDQGRGRESGQRRLRRCAPRRWQRDLWAPPATAMSWSRARAWR